MEEFCHYCDSEKCYIKCICKPIQYNCPMCHGEGEENYEEESVIYCYECDCELGANDDCYTCQSFSNDYLLERQSEEDSDSDSDSDSDYTDQFVGLIDEIDRHFVEVATRAQRDRSSLI